MRLRRFPLALLSLLLTGALIAGCGGDDGGSGGSGGSGGGGGDKADASALLKDAFSADKAVKSGELKLSASADIQGDDDIKGPLKLELSGPFAARGKQLPLLDWSFSASGQGQSFTGKLIATADNAFLGFRGQTYEVGSMLYKQFADQVAKQQGSSSAPTSLADLGIQPETWFSKTEVSDGPSVGGDSTQQVTGDIDKDKMVRDLVDITKSAAVKKQLQAQGQSAPTVSESDIKKVESAIVDPKVVIAVDDDKRLRRLDISTDFKRPTGETSGATGGSLKLLIELPKVGGTPDIKEPSGAKPIQLLFQQLGGLMGGGRANGNGLQTN